MVGVQPESEGQVESDLEHVDEELLKKYFRLCNVKDRCVPSQ